MVTESIVLRKQQIRSGDGEGQGHSSTPPPTAVRRPSQPSHLFPPQPALNDLIRALEDSAQDDDFSKLDADSDASPIVDGNCHVNAVSHETNPLVGGESVKVSTTASDKIEKKKRFRGGKKKPTVSDDDDNSRAKKKKPKTIHSRKSPVATSERAEKAVVAMDDLASTIDDAVREQRIDEKKAKRLHQCIQSGDWADVAFSLLCEQIPLKRKGKGYSCRVCLVPKKGHTCVYCHICSTPENKFKKDDDHVCINCPVCFEEGKKKKKLIQVKREGHTCPHRAPPPKTTEKV